MIKITTAITVAAMLAGCATQPEQIPAAYVSPAIYQDMNCRMLNAEAQRVNGALVQATGQQKAAADSDAGMTAVALVLFWPAAFFINGKGDDATLARLKGEAQAIQGAAVRKSCS